MTRDDLQKKYADLSTKELLRIIDEKFDYTELAVTVAIEEMAKRHVSEEDIKSYKEEEIEKAEEFIKKNIVDDLTLFQKNLFFFIWFPLLTIGIKQNFRDGKFELKLRQANYYSLLGFGFMLVTGFVSVIYDLPDLTSFAMWILSFLLAYGFDEFFNRQRQIDRLMELFGEDTEKDEDQDIAE